MSFKRHELLRRAQLHFHMTNCLVQNTSYASFATAGLLELSVLSVFCSAPPVALHQEGTVHSSVTLLREGFEEERVSFHGTWGPNELLTFSKPCSQRSSITWGPL